MFKKALLSLLLMISGGSLLAQTFWEEDLNSGKPGNWTINDGGTSNRTWEHVNDYKGNTLDGTPFMAVSSDSSQAETLVETIVTHGVNTSGAQKLFVGFDQFFSLSNQERAYVDVWDGSTWQQVRAYGSSKGSWVNPHRAEIEVTSYSNSNLKIRFRYEDNGVWGLHWAIDNIKLWNRRCFDPSGLTATRVNANSAYVTWDSQYPNSADWQVLFGPQGFSPSFGDTITSNNDTTAIGPLNPDTEYDFYVRELCVNGDSSDWVGPESFRTRCSATTIPYEENMETFTVADNATGYICWVPDPRNTATFGGPYRWNTNSGGTGSSSTGPSNDHTTKSTSGVYAYTEASDGAQGDVATLSSSKIDLANTSHPVMTFWYHRYGFEMGELHIDISTDNGQTWNRDVIAPLTGEQQTSETDPWKQKYVDLASYRGDVIMVRFRAVSGGSYEGDMAIDDIRIREAPTRDIKVETFVSPGKPDCYSNNHPVDLMIVNSGLDSIDLTQTSLDITVQVSGSVNQVLTTTVNTNNLNGGAPLGTLDSIVVPVGNVNMGNTGFYSFEAYLDNISGDTLPSNDTIVETFDVQSGSGGTVSGGGPICKGDSATLQATNQSGTVQWQMNDGSGWMNVAATGSDSTTLKVAPPNTTAYRVEVCGSNLSNVDTVSIDEATPPTAKNDTFCKGLDNKAQLEAQGSGEFLWFEEKDSPSHVDTGRTTEVDVKYIDKTLWVSRADSIAKDPILITEMDHGGNDGVEIQNVSSRVVDVSGWTLALNDYTNINDWNDDPDVRWDLSGSMKPGEIRVADENSNQINVGWVSGDEGWAMILDEDGNVIDWAPFGWSQSEIQNFNTTVAGSNVSSSNNWNGTAITACGASNNFQRTGSSEYNDATTWTCNSNKSMGSTNNGLNIPFGSCISERIPVTAIAQECTGISSFEEELSFSLYPNPAKDRFFVEVNSGKSVEGRLLIRDLEGRILKDQERELRSGRNAIDTEGLAKGVYMVNFQSKEGNFTKKLVIR